MVRKFSSLAANFRNAFALMRYRRHIRRLLRDGLYIGKNVTLMPRVTIDASYPHLISIGDNCSLSQGVRIMAHDATAFKFLGATRIGKVEIRENCFIAENVLILPGVTIGPNVLVAAGSVVNKDIGPNSCVAGNPARFYAKFDEFLEKTRQLVSTRPSFQYTELANPDLTHEERQQKLRAAVETGDAFILGYENPFPWTWNPSHPSRGKQD